MKASCSSNVIPQFINEFKPSTLDSRKLNWILNHLRDTYDKHEGERGNEKQLMNTYELLAPILIAGEQSAGETAIRERTMELLFSRRDVEDSEHKTVFTMLSKQKALLEKFGRTLLDVALLTSPEEANNWYAEGHEIFNDDFPNRVASNLACCYAGLKLVEKMCILFKMTWTEVFPITFDECIKHLVYSVQEYLLGGGKHSKSIIEETFEVMVRMNLKYEKDYTLEDSGKTLCIRLKRVYDDYTRYRRDHAILGEVLGYTDFHRQLERTDYFISKNETRYFNGKKTRVWCLDYELLRTVCDIEEFCDSDSVVPANEQT
jgi:hypothetical protein